MPQSFNLKLTFFLPIFFSSKIFIVSIIDSSGTLRLFKKFELMTFPGPVYASSVTTKLSSLSIGFTTVLIFKLYFFAKSKSL